MAKRNTSIKINGKHYDALTGDRLDHVRRPIKSIDGVVRTNAKHVSHAAVRPKIAQPAKQGIKHQPAAHTKSHDIKPSKTLMRHVVAKPTATSLKRQVRVQGTTLAAHHHVPAVRVSAKLSIHSVNESRLTRAAKIAMSPQISRFPSMVEEATAALNKAIVIPQTVSAPRSYRADITPVKNHRPTSSDIFEQALLRATSHEQPAPVTTAAKKRRAKATRSLRHRMVSYGAGAVAVLAIAGFFGFQNADTIQFKVAANRAGFAATMPAYQPTGFNVDSIRSYNGYIGVKYVADTIEGTRTFAITEKPTTWNNQSLVASITGKGESAGYSTIEKAGRTIFVYGRNQAAWVSNGILYQIAGDDTLKNHEFGQIAASM